MPNTKKITTSDCAIQKHTSFCSVAWLRRPKFRTVVFDGICGLSRIDDIIDKKFCAFVGATAMGGGRTVCGRSCVRFGDGVARGVGTAVVTGRVSLRGLNRVKEGTGLIG